jgi:hypothetical protein
VKRSPVRSRFWFEAAFATTTGILAILTMVVHDWAELLFNIDPDEGNGAFETTVTLIALALTLLLGAAARLEWRRRTLLTAG